MAACRDARGGASCDHAPPLWPTVSPRPLPRPSRRRIPRLPGSPGGAGTWIGPAHTASATPLPRSFPPHPYSGRAELQGGVRAPRRKRRGIESARPSLRSPAFVSSLGAGLPPLRAAPLAPAAPRAFLRAPPQAGRSPSGLRSDAWLSCHPSAQDSAPASSQP